MTTITALEPARPVRSEGMRARWNTTPDMARVAELSEQGFLKTEDGHLIATPQGRLVLNRLIAEIAA